MRMYVRRQRGTCDEGLFAQHPLCMCLKFERWCFSASLIFTILHFPPNCEPCSHLPMQPSWHLPPRHRSHTRLRTYCPPLPLMHTNLPSPHPCPPSSPASQPVRSPSRWGSGLSYKHGPTPLLLSASATLAASSGGCRAVGTCRRHRRRGCCCGH